MYWPIGWPGEIWGCEGNFRNRGKEGRRLPERCFFFAARTELPPAETIPQRLAEYEYRGHREWVRKDRV
jgi:hypothetical protein